MPAGRSGRGRPANNRRRETLAAILDKPVRANISWADTESLLLACGAEKTETRGSRALFKLKGIKIELHRPHPGPDIDKGAVISVRKFLKKAEAVRKGVPLNDLAADILNKAMEAD